MSNVFAPAILPLSAGIVMNFLEGLFETFTMPQRLIRVGWDAAVLSVGLTAGVFSDTKVIAFFQPQGIGPAEAECFLAELLCVIAMGYLRKGGNDIGWKALVCLFLGGVALVVPLWIRAYALGFHPQ